MGFERHDQKRVTANDASAREYPNSDLHYLSLFLTVHDMEHIVGVDMQRLKAGEVNLGVRFLLFALSFSHRCLDLDHGRSVRRWRGHWRGQSYNHWKLYREPPSFPI